MTRYDLLIQLPVKTLAEMIYEMSRKYHSVGETEEVLNMEVTEDELQQINAAAQREGHPPFRLHGKENGMLTEGENKLERPLIKNMKEFEALCGPVVKYLRNNGNPYTEVHISQDRITVTSVECGIPLNDNGGQSGMD